MPRAVRQNLVVETRPAGLVLGNQLRLDSAVPVAEDFNRQFAELNRPIQLIDGNVRNSTVY
jgi:hypothetical protein